MPTDPEVIKRIMRDPEFQQLNPQGQLDTMHRYLSGADEEYQALPNVGQQYYTAGKVIDAHTPGFLSKALDILPVVGPVKRAYEDPNHIRPLTRAAAGLMGADEAIKSPLGAATAETLREIAELAALSTVGGPIAKYVGGPIAEAVVPKLGQAMFEKGLVAGAEKTMVAGASKLGIEGLAARAATDGTIGAMYGLVDAVERNDYNPLHMLAAPVMGAALGAGLAGLHNARTRFGPDAAQRVVQTLRENPQLNVTIAEGKPIAARYANMAGVAPEYAGDVVARALTGELLDESEFKVMRQVLTSDRKFLQTDAGLRILQTQKEHLMPKVAEVPTGVEVPTQLHVRVEMPGGSINTLIDPKPSTVQKLMADDYQGRIRILEASGPGEDEFIDKVRDPKSLYEAYRNSLPPAERKKLAQISQQEAEEQFNVMTTERLAGNEPGAQGTENVRGATRYEMFGQPPERLAGAPAEREANPITGQGPLGASAPRQPAGVGQEINPLTGETVAGPVQPGVPEVPGTYAPGPPMPQALLQKLRERVGPDFTNNMIGEQLSSSYDPALRAAIVGETVVPAWRPTVEVPTSIETPPRPGVPRRQAISMINAGYRFGQDEPLLTIPREPGSPIRIAGETGQATVVQDIGTHQVVQKVDGTQGVTTRAADDTIVELVRSAPNMAPEIVTPPTPTNSGPYKWEQAGLGTYNIVDANGNVVANASSRTGAMARIERMQERPGPKPAAAETLEAAVAPAVEGEVPISSLSPERVRQAMEYYDGKMEAGTLTADESKKLSILVNRLNNEKLTTAQLQTCVRIR